MRTRCFQLGLLAIAASAIAPAQLTTASNSTFAVKTTQPGLTQVLSDGGTLAMTSDGIGVSSDATITIGYKPGINTLQAVFTLIDVSGSTDFSSPNASVISNGQFALTSGVVSTSISIRYLPTTSKSVTGKVVFAYSETDTALVPSFRN